MRSSCVVRLRMRRPAPGDRVVGVLDGVPHRLGGTVGVQLCQRRGQDGDGVQEEGQRRVLGRCVQGVDAGSDAGVARAVQDEQDAREETNRMRGKSG